MADDLVVPHPLASGVDDVDELRVAPVQPLAGRRRVKERPARVQPCYPAQSAPGAVAEVGGDLAAEAGADDVDGGGVDGEGRRGEQLDQAEGVLAHETGREERPSIKSPQQRSREIPSWAMFGFFAQLIRICSGINAVISFRSTKLSIRQFKLGWGILNR